MPRTTGTRSEAGRTASAAHPSRARRSCSDRRRSASWFGPSKLLIRKGKPSIIRRPAVSMPAHEGDRAAQTEQEPERTRNDDPQQAVGVALFEYQGLERPALCVVAW